ncbi:MAG: F0F1 ATP synthase subunit B [Bifidobacteriaceae bacterium]|jgi:F-type H+-transporting ATPase subunit b|nr:F0F1 ATP synthase subunit B [Bifidobacteriaceae bacterium]
MSSWLASGGAPEGIGLFLPPVSEIIISVVCLGLIAIVVGKYGVPRYLQVLDERAATIEGGILRAQNAEAEIAQIRAGLDSEKEAARIEAAGVREGAKADGAAIVAEAKAKAVAEAQRITDAAARQIESERKAAEIALRVDVGSLATDLAEKIVGEALKDSAVASRVIDRFLADLESQSKVGKNA